MNEMGDREVCAAIHAAIAMRERPVGADDPAIYEALKPMTERQVREAILRLVKRGVLLAGDGYLRRPTDG